jgi:ribosomal protein S12 methylthiotransferase
MVDQVPEDVKQERYEAVMALSARISEQKLARKVGSTIEVLIDRVDEHPPLDFDGRGTAEGGGGAPVAHLDAPHPEHHHKVGATGRSKADGPEIDGEVHLRDAGGLKPGDIVSVRVEDSDEHDLYGVPLEGAVA